MSKTKKIISLLIAVMLVMTMATVAIVSTSALAEGETYYVAGSGGLCGSDWNPADSNNQMTWKDGIYEKVFTNVAAGSYEFCVVKDGMWDAGQWNLTGVAGYENNAHVTVDVAGSTVTVGFNGTNATVDVTAGSDTPDTPDVPDVPEDTTPVVGDGAKVYFTNNKGWGAVYAYAYDANGAVGAEWPGTAMTFVETNGYGEDIYSAEIPAGVTAIVFNGGVDQPQTVDVADVVDGQGYYPDQEVEGKWTVGTYTYETPDTTPDESEPVVDTTPDETEPVETAPVVTDPIETAPVVTDPAASETEPAASETEPVASESEPAASESEPAGDDTAVIVNGTANEVAVGDVVTYYVDLTAARLFENIQALVSYDADKLELTRIKSDDPDVEDWEVEGPAFCPNLEGVILNAGTEGVVKFNASKVAGYNFKEGANLITLEFTVIADGESEIALTIEEMTIKGGDESYFTGGQQVTTEGIEVNEYLVAPEHEDPSSEPTATETEPVETAPSATETEPVETAPVETKPVETAPVETEPVETEPVETAPAASEDPTSATDGEDKPVDKPVTGAAAYIYVVLAVLTMAAGAVVVLRKRANG